MNCIGRFSELHAGFGRTYENCLGRRLGDPSGWGLFWACEYRALYGQRGLWVRPAAMFEEQVLIDGVKRPRFERYGDCAGSGNEFESK